MRSLPFATRLVYLASQFVAHLLLPAVLLRLLIRSRREPAYRARLGERFGFGPVGAPGAVWVYAASLGETRAASPLVERLRAEGYRVLLTHATPAGLAEGERLFPDDRGIVHRYVPLDLFWAVRVFLARARPRLGVVCEIEIWPAMLCEAARAGVPMVMVNGNLLERSIGGQEPRGLRRHVMALYGLFAHVFTRTEAYAARYRRIGVAPDRISVVGEMKYDQRIDPRHPAAGAALRRRWRGEAPVLVIASSVAAEEEAIAGMLRPLLRPVAGGAAVRVVWVPRSPQRFDAVAARAAAEGWRVLRRSALGPDPTGTLPEGTDTLPEGTEVIIGDSLGEMNLYCAMADLVFVGASLNGDGGHNIMEPMALGKPVVMGPSIYGIAFAAEPAAEAGAFESLPDAATLGARIAALMADRAALGAMSAAAGRFAASQKGAADRTLAGLGPWLGAGAGGAPRA
jgi:3-deoxy-D-manno-octulosonic-acid transferase